MIKLSPEEAKMLIDIGRQYPKFTAILSNWRNSELETLVYATKETSDVIRGRVQSLGELHKAITKDHV